MQRYRQACNDVVGGEPVNLSTALKISAAFVAELEPCCHRIAVAGSIRRGKPQVGDLDIVLIPKMVAAPKAGLFDQGETVMAIDAALTALAHESRIRLVSDGPKIKRGVFIKSVAADFEFDLYVADELTWTTLMLIRTGSKESNIRLCKRAQDLGMKLKADGSGVVAANGELIRCETEADVYAALGLDFVQPVARD